MYNTDTPIDVMSRRVCQVFFYMNCLLDPLLYSISTRALVRVLPKRGGGVYRRVKQSASTRGNKTTGTTVARTGGISHSQPHDTMFVTSL